MVEPGTPRHPLLDDGELRGQVALVTGGSRGIGLATGRALARRGAHVLLASRHLAEAERAASSLVVDGLSASSVALDVTDEQMVASVVDSTIHSLGGIQILINNAGSSGPPTQVWETPTDFFESMLRVHLIGTFFCVRAVVPQMIDAGYGRIVNVSSVAGKEGNAGKGAYSAAKAGVIGLTKSLGKELARTGVIVNAVTPTVVNTAILDQTSPDHLAQLTARIPMGRRGEASEVAEMVAWAASPRCSFTTGSVFDVSGGRTTY